MGDGETDTKLRNRIGQGRFSAGFLVQWLVAMGVHAVRLHEAILRW